MTQDQQPEVADALNKIETALRFQRNRIEPTGDEGVEYMLALQTIRAHLQQRPLPVREPTDETPAEEALRSLACWLGVGGYNAPTVDAKVFEAKIREGVTTYLPLHGMAARNLAELVLDMGMVTDKGIRARELARRVLGIVPPAASPSLPVREEPTGEEA